MEKYFIQNCIAGYPNLVTESPKYAKSRDFREERVTIKVLFYEECHYLCKELDKKA